MNSKRYIKEFLKSNGIDNESTASVNRIIDKENEFEMNLLKWEFEQLDDFLKSLNSISAQNVRRHLYILRKFADFICAKENIPSIEFNVPRDEFDDYINKEELLSVTLSYEQYREIKNQLTIIDGGEELNVRDKLIFELAWSGLTNEEIKLLREDAIEFVKNDYNEIIALLTLNNRSVRIEDSEIVDDIKKCMKEEYYIVRTSAGVTKKMKYKDSEYLIKAVSVGRTKSTAHLDNPGNTLKNVFVNNDINCQGINVFNLTLEDIRRSKIVYLLAPENREYFDDETVAALFNLRQKHGITWLKDIARTKYGKTKN